MGPAAGTAAAAGRIGPFDLAPGWSARNAATVWVASFVTIGLAAFVSFLQPYLLNEVLRVPVAEQGRLTGNLGFLQEVVVIVLAGFAGAWSDRVGRRRVFCAGLLAMAAGLVVYPFASGTVELALFRLVFAVGVALAPLMLSACVVDATAERCRGRWVASNNLLQGFGVVVMSLLLARLPLWFAARGAEPALAGRLAFWTAALVALAAAVVMARGLPGPGAAPAADARSGLGASVLAAARHGLANPRLALAYGAAFIGRGDFVIIGAFFSLWVTQAGLAEGMSPAASIARGGMLFGILQLAAMGWAFFMGMISDRIGRVAGLCIALAIASVAYFLLGQSADPFARGFIPVAMLVGVGEISVIVASSALLGQEAPQAGRGPVVGLYNAVGGAGILFATLAGGYVFDHVGPTAPFTMMAGLNAALLAAALLVRRGQRQAAATSQGIPP